MPSRQDKLKELIESHRERLYLLTKRKAELGLSADVSLDIDIKWTEREIERLQEELISAEDQVDAEDPPDIASSSKKENRKFPEIRIRRLKFLGCSAEGIVLTLATIIFLVCSVDFFRGGNLISTVLNFFVEDSPIPTSTSTPPLTDTPTPTPTGTPTPADTLTPTPTQTVNPSTPTPPPTVGQSHTRHLYRKNTLVMSFREAQRREIFGYKASLDPTEKISRSYRRSK